MFEFIKDIMLRLTGVHAVLVKVIDSIQSAIKVIELLQSELKNLGISESSVVAVGVLKDWLVVINGILVKILSIKIDDQPIFSAQTTDAVEELKKKLDALKSI